MEFKINNLASIIDLVQVSVLGTEIGNLIDVLATSDIRLALRMSREFLHSGYTATGRALEIYHATGKYIMPQHEALRAIMTGNRPVYSDQYSVIGNPFDAHLSRTEAQLLRLYVLNALVQYSSESSFQYLSGSEVQQVFRQIGFGDEVALSILSDLCKLRFVHTSSHSQASLEASYLPSRLGGYIVRQLICSFTFVENTMMDTSVPDQIIWDRLRSLSDRVYSQRDTVVRVKTRTERAAVFFDYIKQRFSILRDESARRGLSHEWCSHPLIAIEPQFKANLMQVENSARRNYGSESLGVGSGHESSI